MTVSSSHPIEMPSITLVRRGLGVALVAATALSLSVRPAAAQKAHSASGDKDMQVLANYRLSEPGLRKFYKAMENIATAAMKDSSVQTDDDSDNDASGSQDLASMAARYDRVPALKRAIASTGLTSMEFATFSMSFMQASMANSMMQGPANMRLHELPKGTPKENVDFIHSHQALIESLNKEVQKLQQSLGVGPDTLP